METNGFATETKPSTRTKKSALKEEVPTVITITPIYPQVIGIRLIGETDCIIQQFSEKAKRQIEDKQQGKNRTKKLREPEQEFESAKYKCADGRDGIPAIVLKTMAVSAARYHNNITKVDLRGSMFVIGDTLPLQFESCEMRKDMVRLGGIGRPADIRYRPAYHNWSIEFHVKFNPNVLTPETILSLYLTAGFSIGLGENRPEKSGNNFGQFKAEIFPVK